jgi:hypothetical protein
MFKNLNKIFYMNRRFNRNVTVWGNIHNNYKSNNIHSINKFIYLKNGKFCTLSKLEVEKLKLEKLEEGKKMNLKTIEKEFIKEDNIIEFSPAVSWEETVLKSEIPVIVDIYAS